jgi:hypothetical protein
LLRYFAGVIYIVFTQTVMFYFCSRTEKKR